MPGPNTLHFWLATVARELREAGDKKARHIAAAMDRDQSVVYRFEQVETWPRDPDLFIAAYAQVLDIDDPRDIWEQAIDRWRSEGAQPTIDDLITEFSFDGPAAFEQAIDDGAQATGRSRARSARTPAAKRSRRAAG